MTNIGPLTVLVNTDTLLCGFLERIRLLIISPEHLKLKRSVSRYFCGILEDRPFLKVNYTLSQTLTKVGF